LRSVIASSAVNRGFELRSGQTKDYKRGICCFSAKHAALRRKSKDWLARNQDKVSEWSDMSTRGLLFQWASTITSNSALNNNHSLTHLLKLKYIETAKAHFARKIFILALLTINFVTLFECHPPA